MKKIIISAFIFVSAFIAVSCGGGGGGSSMAMPTIFPDIDYDLGVTSFNSGTGIATFKVWAPNASNVTLKLYGTHDDNDDESVYKQSIAMVKDLTGNGYAVDADYWNGVWVAEGVTNVVNGDLYNYSIDGVYYLDPYAKSMTTYTGSGYAKGAVVDMGSDATLPDGDWAESYSIQNYTDKNDAIIYEVHVRDFTIKITAGDSSLDGATHGMYKAFKAKLDHIKTLGATHVQLLPVLAAKYGDESKNTTYESGYNKTSNCNYNWGFDPQNYFSPEGMYSETPADPLARVNELRTLVNEAHKQGLGIILDVVYNHTADTTVLGIGAGSYFYRGTNASGCGNDTASERLMMRKLIIDSITFWTENYKIDGFRFDLMGIHDNETMEQAYTEASKINPNILFLGEGWMNMYLGDSTDYEGNNVVGANQGYMASTDNFAVFSDSFRDVLKGGGMSENDATNSAFLTGNTTVSKTDILSNLRGSATNFTSTIPGDCVNYLTAHDGLTLHDKISKIMSLNPSNATQKASIFKIAKLAHIMQLTSQGIIFIHAGCEMGRSKPSTTTLNSTKAPSNYYCYNSYDASDDINGIDWSTLTASGSENEKLYNYVTGLIGIRNSSDAFKLGAISITNVAEYVTTNNKNAISYKVTNGTDTFLVFVNASTSSVTFSSTPDTLTAASVEVLADDDEASASGVSTESGITRSANSIAVPAYTGAILKL